MFMTFPGRCFFPKRFHKLPGNLESAMHTNIITSITHNDLYQIFCTLTYYIM